jgi:hypothetical protein
VKELCGRLQGEIEQMTAEMVLEKRDAMEFQERIKRLVGVNQYQSFGNGQSMNGQILNQVELVMDELRVRRDES